jgi:hypothetical protein
MTAPAAEKKNKKDIRRHSQCFLHGFDQPFNRYQQRADFYPRAPFPERCAGGFQHHHRPGGRLSDSMDSLFRIFSGWFSDKIGKRKLLATLGYSISTAAKPFMLLANSWGAVLGVRLGDRVGKGTRSSSRDALIADSVEAKDRGRAFGLHRAMDTSGAVIGLIIAAIIVYMIPGDKFHLTRTLITG